MRFCGEFVLSRTTSKSRTRPYGKRVFYEDLLSTELCTPNGVHKNVSDFKILTLRINYIIIIGLLPKKIHKPHKMALRGGVI